MKYGAAVKDKSKKELKWETIFWYITLLPLGLSENRTGSLTKR